MKTTILKSTAVAIVAVITMSFGIISNGKKEINTSDSIVNWVGEKEIGSGHAGTLHIKEGSLEFANDKLVGGMVVVDMTTLTVTDLEGGKKEKLEGHLKADDFFGTAKFDSSKIIFTKVVSEDGNYVVTGDLTIKGITETITFDLSVAGNTASAKLSVDRTKFGVKYGSSSFFDGLKDKAIKNEFELNVSLVF